MIFTWSMHGYHYISNPTPEKGYSRAELFERDSSGYSQSKIFLLTDLNPKSPPCKGGALPDYATSPIFVKLLGKLGK